MLKKKLFKGLFVFFMVPKVLVISDSFPRAQFLLRDKFASRGAVGKYILSINGA